MNSRRASLRTRVWPLDEFDALYKGRYRLDHPDDCLDDMSDPITIRLDQLPLLAYPFGPAHARTATTTG